MNNKEKINCKMKENNQIFRMKMLKINLRCLNLCLINIINLWSNCKFLSRRQKQDKLRNSFKNQEKKGLKHLQRRKRKMKRKDCKKFKKNLFKIRKFKNQN